MALGVPLFAKVEGDASGVSLAWWAVKGAAGYEIERAADPRGAASVRARLPGGTLGYRDTLPAMPAAYFQLVAVASDGTRSAGAWMLVNSPTIAAVTAGPAGVVISWTTAQPATGGFEIWRAPDPQKPAARIGASATGVTTFTDPKPPATTAYYQVVAIGSGARAASTWAQAATVAAGNAATPAVAPAAVLPVAGSSSGCSCPGPQGPPGPAGPQGLPGAAAPVKEILQQIASLQRQLDTLAAIVAVDASGSTSLTAARDMAEQVGGSQSVTVNTDRTTRIVRDDTLSVGRAATTSVGTTWQLASGKGAKLSVGTGVALQANTAGLTIDASGGSLTIPASWTEAVGQDRSTNLGHSDTLKVGMAATTSVGTDWDLTAAQNIALNAGRQISLSSGQASIRINPDGSIVISGTSLDVKAAGDLQLTAGGTLTIKAAKLVTR
ncbi:MAG TPA: hypothetical protein VFK87_00340 [Steroidobacteraceae bacterium]|nr:hypothetical protein [Steroidobacteraceae bacterium]